MKMLGLFWHFPFQAAVFHRVRRVMKCPECGDVDQQGRIGSGQEPAELSCYRCSKCGRLYTVPADIATLSDSLAKMNAKLASLGAEMGSLSREIAETEAELIRMRHQRDGSRSPR